MVKKPDKAIPVATKAGPPAPAPDLVWQPGATHPAVLDEHQAVTATRAGRCARVKTGHGYVPCWPGDTITSDGEGGYKVIGADGKEVVPSHG